MMTFESKSRRPLSTRAITAIAVTDLLTLAILELIIIIVITMTTRIKIIINWTWKASLLWLACWLSPQSTPCKNIWSSCKLSLMTKSCNTSMVSPWQGTDSRGGRWSWQSWLDSRSTVCVGNLSGKSCLCTTPWQWAAVNTDHMVKVQTADEQMKSLHCWQMVMVMIVDSLHILGDWGSFDTEYMIHIIWCQ